MASRAPQRFIPQQECVNFRDLGGYTTGNGMTVGWGRLFRSDPIHLMTGQDDTISKRQ
ncbi:MAG: tyrosine-protein phosphatase [Chloroflexi bacterium]|nr:tyrosine-protein phosphatase [Chloroflexota bacterium]